MNTRYEPERSYTEFDSPNELVEYAFSKTTGENDKNMHEANDYMERKPRLDPQWYNNQTTETIRKSLHECPAHLYRAITEMKRSIEDLLDEMPTRRRRKVRHNLDMGDEIDVDAWLNNQTNPWSAIVRHDRETKVIRIAVNTVVNCTQHADALLYRGAVACALTDLLTEAGKSVELVTHSVTEGISVGHKYASAACILKQSHDPLSISSIATVLCDIGFTRLVWHQAQRRISRERVSGHLGRVCSLSRDEASSYDIVIDSNISTREKAVQVIRQKFQQYQTQASQGDQ